MRECLRGVSGTSSRLSGMVPTVRQCDGRQSTYLAESGRPFAAALRGLIAGYQPGGLYVNLNPNVTLS